MTHLAVGLVALTALAGSACARPSSNGASSILLFNGTGTSANDVAAIETILNDSRLDYTSADSSHLNGMSDTQLMAYRLLIMPGGNFIEMGNGLTPATLTRVRNAVQGGVNYLGICAGAFLAGHASYRSLNLTSGVRFEFYADEGRGIRKAAVPIVGVGTPPLDHYWEDGPQLTGWGDVVAKYPDGTAAVVEGSSGQGWVILVGVHPEAPENWRHGMTFRTPASVDNAYAATLIDAALRATRLPHY